MYLPSADDEPGQIDWREIARHAKVGRSFLTSGPYLEVRTEDGTQPGGLVHAKGSVKLHVRVQCTDWVDIDRVQVLVLNHISATGLSRLPAEAYRVAKDVPQPAAILVRSADMHAMAIPDSVHAIGRAGAGRQRRHLVQWPHERALLRAGDFVGIQYYTCMVVGRGSEGQARATLPGVSIAPPEATYLAWLDCRRAGIPGGDPYTFFLERAKVAWRLPSGPGAVKRLGAEDKSAFNQLEKFAKTLFESPVKGDAELVRLPVPKPETNYLRRDITAVLEQAGTGWANVVKTTVYLHDMSDFPMVNEIYARVIGDARPARSTVQVSGLPRAALVEIDAVAVID